jgi:hypothetical protein
VTLTKWPGMTFHDNERPKRQHANPQKQKWSSLGYRLFVDISWTRHLQRQTQLLIQSYGTLYLFWQAVCFGHVLLCTALSAMLIAGLLTWSLTEFPQAWLSAEKKPLFPKLLNALRNGLNGSIGIAYPSMLALFANLPNQV